MTQSVEQLSPTDRTKAEALLARVESLLDKSRANYEAQLRNHAEIGEALVNVRASRAWLLTEHKTFESFIKGCEQSFGRGRTSLFGYMQIAERLLPLVDKSSLIEMGITKAGALAGYVKKKGKPTPALLEAAINPQVGVDEFKQTVASVLHEQPEKSGKWRSLGFFATDEEFDEIERAIELAKQQAEVPADLPEWVRLKFALQAMCMECISSWEGK